MNQDEMLELLQELLSKHAPPGDESGIEPVIWREMEKTGVKVWQDRATNIYAHVPGDGPKVMVCAHKDEIAMIVTHVLDNGRLKVTNIGGCYPWKYGEGPVDILADNGEVLRGILSVGSVHTDNGPVHALKRDKALLWEDVTVFTGLKPEKLAEKGIHPGTRVVVARERKQIQHVGKYIASYALDDRLGLVTLIATLQEVVDKKLPLDLYFVATSGEEIGFLGALAAARKLQPEICIALDTSPVTNDVPSIVSDSPTIWYGEAVFNDKQAGDTLLRLANELGFGAQPVVYSDSASDAGGAKRVGLVDSSIAFGFPRDNSHGYEIAHPRSMVNVKNLLIAYLEQLT